MSEIEKPYNLGMLLEMEADEPGTMAKILEIFLQSIPEVLNDFMNCYNSNDISNLGNTAHKLKSSIDLLSLTEISALLKKIELSAKKGENLEEIPGWVQTVNTELLKVFELLRQEIA